MDRERLAAYVAGELDADERAEIEARLARDPALRGEVARLEQVERALDGVAPATPADGFDQRLGDHLAPVLDEVLGPADEATTPAAPGPWASGGDELARRRSGPRWLPAVTGAAAGLALLGVAGVALSGLWEDDAGPDTAMEADDLDAGDDDMRATGREGPQVLATERDLDEAGLDELLEQRDVDALRREGLAPADGRQLAESYAAELRGGDTAGGRLDGEETADAPAMEGEEAPTDDVEDTAAPDAEDGEAAPEAAGDDAAVARCLDAILGDAPDPAPIPVYVELLRYEGEPAIAYALLSPDGEGAYDRVEVWVVDRADCQVRELRQRDGQ